MHELPGDEEERNHEHRLARRAYELRFPDEQSCLSASRGAPATSTCAAADLRERDEPTV
jgi:hypothetical protein